MTLSSIKNPSPQRHWDILISRPEGIELREAHEVAEEVLFGDIYDTLSFVDIGESWLDVGCHVGLFAIAALQAGASQVFVVDSDRSRVEHAVSNARIFHMALQGERGEPGVGKVSGMAAFIEHAQDLPLDGLPDEKLCLKLDIQGFEKGVFADGGAELIAQNFEKLAFEWHYPIDDLELPGWTIVNQKKHRDVLLNTDTWIVWAEPA